MLNSTTTPENTSATTPLPQIDPIVHINVPNHTKLTNSNFLSWKNQIQLIVEGHDLDSYLHNSSPDPTIRNAAGEFVLNPAYLSWKRQDKLLNAWIRSSLSDSILAQVMSSPTCKDLWQALESYFSTSSHARLQDLKRQLQTVSKGDSNCTKYLNRVRRIADELSFIGNSIPEEDLVTAAINGLGSEFNSLKAALLTVRWSQFHVKCLALSYSTTREVNLNSPKEVNSGTIKLLEDYSFDLAAKRTEAKLGFIFFHGLSHKRTEDANIIELVPTN